MIDIKPYIFAFLDVETTGLSAWFGDRVCEIAIERVHRNEIQDTFTTLVNPEREISPGAARVNGLTNDDLCDAPRFAEIANRVESLLADAVIVCHNSPFDLGFIDNEFSRLEEKFKAPQVVDTLWLAREFFYFDSNSLGSIAEELEISTPNAHRALGDVVTTRRVFQHFLRELSKEGFTHLDELVSGYVSQYKSPDEILLPPIIEEALKNGERLHITYKNQKGGQSKRWITLKQVLTAYNSTYLIAYCHLRESERNFRLDRIVEMKTE
ncbi:MAG: WYL domain-containing protein [Anaerolineales bacterium]|nr:WYL domain-containing protein [Chloroflexota bacterium]MBL6981035.1 WYL domain-containing protein [Anaerolineales bacterium]